MPLSASLSPRGSIVGSSDEKASGVTDIVETGGADHTSKVSPAAAWMKLDLVVLPLIVMMYFLSSMDRTNIGNARIAGIQKDLGMSNNQYSFALTLALIPYVLVEVFFNYVMIHVGPRILLPTLVCLWGIACACQGLVHNYSGLLACRFFLGLFEGGLPPGVFFYLASFYPRNILQLRMSFMFSAAAFAGAFSGLLAAAIIHMDGVGGRPGWAWVFILEGLFSFVFGLVAYILLPNTPKSAFTLNNAEKEFVSKALLADGIVEMSTHASAPRPWEEIRRGFAQPHVIPLCICAFFSGVTVSSLSYYLPSIVASLGFSGTRAQLMSVPPFVASGFLSIATAILADRFSRRGLTVIFFSILSTVGFAMFLSSEKHVRYGSLFFAVPGTYAIVAPLGTWTANNTSPLLRRATSLAFLTSSANAGAILATWLYGALSTAPRYTSATITLLVLQVGCLICAVGTMVYLWNENRRKARLREEFGPRKDAAGTDLTGSSVELPNESIWFTYVM